LTPQFVALAFISVIVLLGSVIAFLARFHRKMDLEQWTIGGRGFGLVLVWLLMAGEIYTTFTFLGASGWAYSRGAPIFFNLGQAPLIYVFSFFILPLIWEEGRKYGLQTQADFFQVRYGSTYLAAFAALVGVVSLIPYVQLQITGLGRIVEVASFGVIPRTPAMITAFALVAGFVFTSGVRGIAWASILKDLLLLSTAFVVGISVPHIYFGGVGQMFAALDHAKPGHLVLPGATKALGHSWYVSTVLLTSLAFYMWPHYFAATYTARSGKILRRNAVIMPLYSITTPLLLIVGFTAVLVLPDLPDGDLSLLITVRKTFPAWFLGLVGGAGALTAMVCAAIQLLCGATLCAKNLFRPMIAPGLSDHGVATTAKVMVLVLTAGALFFAIYSSLSLVSLFLLGFAGIAQLLPGVVLGLYSRRVTSSGVFAGMATGIWVAMLLILTGHDPFYGVNAGFIALCCNFAITAVASLLTWIPITGFDETRPVLRASESNDLSAQIKTGQLTHSQ
jgi:solute:Na+ symporter, SSS family